MGTSLTERRPLDHPAPVRYFGLGQVGRRAKLAGRGSPTIVTTSSAMWPVFPEMAEESWVN